MGQESSAPAPAPSHEQLAKELAHKFAEKCFTPLDIFSFKDVFKSLADHEHHVQYLKEDTIARFLEIPDILGVSPVLFQLVSHVGAFPFLQDAPAVLGAEQMIIVITIMTKRYERVLAKGAADRRKLLFRSMAVYDRKQPGPSENPGPSEAKLSGGDRGHEGDEDSNEEEPDELVLETLDYLDYGKFFKQQDSPSLHGALVPADNLRKLIMLLLLVASLDAQESLSLYSDRVSGDALHRLRSTAECVLAAFLDVERSPGINFARFNAVIPSSMPFLFDGFTPLFEHFLFSKHLDFHKHKDETKHVLLPVEVAQPLLQEEASIMTLDILSQLSFFIPGTSLFRRLRLLYSGDDDGFSMGSFETKVFNWRAPTILLIRGARLPDDTAHKSTASESAFLSALPPKRFRNGSGDENERLTFGLYVGQPWKHTNRECFGGEDTLLFQLEPIHDVFRASTINKDYVSYTKPSASTSHAGISFGCPPPTNTQTYRRSSTIALGTVSLVLDSSFEFGCFTHDYTSRGGAFQPSPVRDFDFQERFEIESLEVWGCGGDEEAKHQAEHWAWEAREAEARRRINLGTGDIEADRALLEMAGLIGQNRSGGSIM
ncbi:restriction of telomere capping protein 5 [Podospora aff. communis PSN243]|uniref:Restriction of telomere capping protein 5 n=1 Tax=Podospora aff. communis PSN243 TaxID=3040156 RepID=A0AAV9GUX6_9PEZI|nr:restriction of telomere capping protein 5 [Podospora aff. communis PSN243]